MSNFHSVFMSIETLLIECKGCNHRAALTREDGAPIWQGNMTLVRDAKFRCRRCRGADVRAYIPLNQDQVDMFLAGDPVGTMRRAN